MSDNQVGWVIDDDGCWHYYYSNGEMATGWKEIGNDVYYFYDNGKMVTSWVKYGDEWYYLYPGGSMARNGPIPDNTNSNGFDLDSETGKMVSGEGWLKDQVTGNWYYYSDGEMTTGWRQIGSDWYYFHTDGTMATGWVKDKGEWYFLWDNGSMAYDRTYDGYHLDSQGKMITGTGWVSSDGSWYYIKDDGTVANGWLYVNGNWYFLYPQGSMAHATWINEYYVDNNGKWITDDDENNNTNLNSSTSGMQSGWMSENGSWYYYNSDGKKATGWMQYGSDWYYLNADGKMVTEGQTIDGIRYYFNSSGKWQRDGIEYLLGPTSEEAAEMAQHVYFKNYDDVEGSVLPGGWTLTDHYSPSGTSLQIGVYSRTWSDGQTEYALVYRGSRLPNEHLEDWMDNWDECMGDSNDVKNGITYADYFVSNHPDAHITFVGHSKGGPEAIAAAVVEKKDAIVFNPAAPHITDMGINISNYSGKITAYVVKGEVLNTWQDTNELDNLNAKIIYLPQQHRDYGKGDAVDEIDNHSMESVINALKQYDSN